MEQKDLLIVVQDCKTYFWRGNIFLSSGPLGVQKEKEKGGVEGNMLSVCSENENLFFSLMLFKGNYLCWCWSRATLSVYSSSLIFWPRNWNVVIITLLLSTLPRKSFQQSYLHKEAFKTRVENGDTVSLWYFSDSSTVRLLFNRLQKIYRSLNIIPLKNGE